MLAILPGWQHNQTVCQTGDFASNLIPSDVYTQIPAGGSNPAFVITANNGTYDQSLMESCCKNHNYTVVDQCVLWCRVPDDVAAKNNNGTNILDVMNNCVGKQYVSQSAMYYYGSAGVKPYPSRTHLVVAGALMLPMLLF